MSNNSFFSKEIEMSVIGQFLNFPEQLVNINLVYEDDFFIAEHKILFKIIRDMFIKNYPLNLCLIFEEIKKEDCLIKASYITEISQISSIKEDICFYIKILKEKSACRKLFQIFNNTINTFSKSNLDPEKLLNKIQKDLEKVNSSFHVKINNQSAIGEIINFSSEDSESVFKKIEKSFRNREQSNQDYEDFIHTGFPSIDNRSSILENGNLVVLAARPSLGKTALALNFALNISKKQIPVGFFSLEMSKQQIAERLISLLSKKSCEDLKRGRISEEEFDNIKLISETLSKIPFYVGGTDFSSFNQMCSQARRWKHEKNIGVLFIDYLQLIVLNREVENRQNEIAKISRDIKQLSQELNIPIVCLSQLSRKVEDRGDKRPLMSDIRDSGQVEQDADVIILLNKRAFSNKQEERNIELCIGKNRHGATFSTFLRFDQQYGGFSDVIFEW